MTLEFSSVNSGAAEIGFKAGELYDFEFASMSGNTLKKTITIRELEIAVDYPEFKVTAPETVDSDKEFTIFLEFF